MWDAQVHTQHDQDQLLGLEKGIKTTTEAAADKWGTSLWYGELPRVTGQFSRVQPWLAPLLAWLTWHPKLFGSTQPLGRSRAIESRFAGTAEASLV